MEGKHRLCKHPDSCLINALKGFLQGAVVGIGIRAAIVLAIGLFRRTFFKNPAMMLKVFSSENIKLVYFLCGTVGIHRAVLCLFRRLTNNEKISSFAAGFCSAIPLAIEHSDSRVEYSLYMVARAMDAFCVYLVSAKLVPTIPYLIEIVYILSFSALQYIKVWNPECIHAGYSSMLNRFLKEPNDPLYIDMRGVHDHILLKKK